MWVGVGEVMVGLGEVVEGEGEGGGKGRADHYFLGGLERIVGMGWG